MTASAARGAMGLGAEREARRTAATPLAAREPATARLEPSVVSGAGRGGDLRPLLERDGVLILDVPSFRLDGEELRLADARWGDGRSKNVSYNPLTGKIDGVLADGPTSADLRALLARFSAWAGDMLAAFFPAYHASAELGRTSFRRRSAAEAPLSARKDDRRLHVDAFTSQPVAGRRILRVFSNVDPTGEAREWVVGEGFEDYARRFLPRARRLRPGEAAVLQRLTLTKSRRTDYDQIMLTMHDAAKGDRTYQSTAPRRRVSFPAGATWAAFTDQSPHAVVSGQCALEQTFYLPIESLADPAVSPLRILERLCGGALV